MFIWGGVYTVLMTSDLCKIPVKSTLSSQTNISNRKMCYKWLLLYTFITLGIDSEDESYRKWWTGHVQKEVHIVNKAMCSSDGWMYWVGTGASQLG